MCGGGAACGARGSRRSWATLRLGRKQAPGGLAGEGRPLQSPQIVLVRLALLRCSTGPHQPPGAPLAAGTVVVRQGGHVCRPGRGHLKMSVQTLPLVVSCRQCCPVGKAGEERALGAPVCSLRLGMKRLPRDSRLASPLPWHFRVLLRVGSRGSLRPPGKPPPALPQSACGRRPPEGGQS